MQIWEHAAAAEAEYDHLLGDLPMIIRRLERIKDRKGNPYTCYHYFIHYTERISPIRRNLMEKCQLSRKHALVAFRHTVARMVVTEKREVREQEIKEQLVKDLGEQVEQSR